MLVGIIFQEYKELIFKDLLHLGLGYIQFKPR